MILDDVPLRPVLLVEDDALVAMVTEETLRMLGFEPTTVGSAAEALAVFAQGLAPPVAVLDVGLPDMKGNVLAHKLLEISPSLRIVLASGYDRAELSQGFADAPGVRILSKPYSESQLRQVLQELDAPDRPPA